MVENRAAFLAEQGGNRGLFLDELYSPLSQLIAASQNIDEPVGKRLATDVLRNLVLVFHDMPWIEPIPVERFNDGTFDALLTLEHLSQILSWRGVPGYIERSNFQLMQQVVRDLMPGRISPEAVTADLPDYYAERAEALGGGVWRHEVRQRLEAYYESQGIKDSKAAHAQAERMDMALSNGVYLNRSFYDQGVVIAEWGIREPLITPKGIVTMLTWDRFPRGKNAAGISPKNLAVLKWVLEELAREKGIELYTLEK